MTLVLEPTWGPPEVLATEVWDRAATVGETRLLAAARTPLLDVGCGPGRIVAAVAGLGLPALGIDASPAAISRTLSRGVPALRRSVFDRLPGEGRWATVVLFDGNVGIGGDVRRLLARCASMLARDGELLVEVAAPGSPRRVGPARLITSGTCSPWFPWSWAGATDVERGATGTGLVVRSRTTIDGRWFLSLAQRCAVAAAGDLHPSSCSPSRDEGGSIR
jgi:SAM-dependent methyltransferase